MVSEKQMVVDSDELNLQDVWSLVLDHWKLFLASILVMLCISIFFIWQTPPTFRVKATVLVGDEGSDISQSILDEVGVIGKKKNVENEIAIISSRFLMNKAVSSLKMNVNCIADLGLRSRELYTQRPLDLEFKFNQIVPDQFSLDILVENETLLQTEVSWEDISGVEHMIEMVIEPNHEFSVPFGTLRIVTTPWFKEIALGDSAYSKRYTLNYTNDELLTSHYMEQLSVETARQKASILELTLVDHLKERGEDVLDRLLEVYISNSVDKKNLLTSNALTFIDDQLNYISDELIELESEIKDYKTINRISDVGTEASFFLDQVGDLDKQVSDIDVRISFVEYLYSYVLSNNSLENASPTSLGIHDPLLIEILTTINELTSEKESLLLFTKKDNPLIAALDIKINAAKESLVNNILSIKSGLLASKAQLEKQQETLEIKVKGLPKAEYDLLALERKYSIKESLYLLLLEKRSENAIMLASTVSDNFVLDKARGGEKPISPKKSIIMLFGLVIGIGLPLLALVLRSMFDNTIKSKGDISRSTSISLIGSIPHNQTESQLIMNASSHSAIAEAFRSLRTNIGFISASNGHDGEKPATILQLTSSFGSEGKSFCSINLAASLALTGQRTIVLGLDLRKPKLAEYFNVSNDLGVSTILAGMNNLEDCILSTKVENLDLLVAGPIPPNPSELLLGGELAKLLDKLKEDYRYIILDTPPIGLVSDALTIAEHVHATIYVIRQGVTSSRDLDYINDVYMMERIRNISILFNDVKFGSKYGYSYGYGYYEPVSKGVKKWSVPFRT